MTNVISENTVLKADLTIPLKSGGKITLSPKTGITISGSNDISQFPKLSLTSNGIQGYDPQGSIATSISSSTGILNVSDGVGPAILNTTVTTSGPNTTFTVNATRPFILAEFRAIFIAAPALVAFQDLRIVIEGGTFGDNATTQIHNGCIACTTYNTSQTLSTPDAGKWFYAFRVKDEKGWSNWSDGNITPSNVRSYISLDTYALGEWTYTQNTAFITGDLAIDIGTIGFGDLAADAVHEINIAANAVSTGKIQPAAITTPLIAAGAIGANLIAANAVLAVNIFAGAVTSDKISSNAIDGKVITGATIQTSANNNEGIKLTSASLKGYNGNAVETFNLSTDGSLFLSGVITALNGSNIPTSYLNGTILEAQIANAAISTAKFATGLRPVELLATLGNAGNVGRVAYNTTDFKLYRDDGNNWTAAVPTSDLSGTIATAQIAANAVTANQIEDLAITAAKVANNAIEASKIAANAVEAGKIAANAVGSTEIAAGSVIAGKIAANAVTSATIEAGAIIAGKLGANSVEAGTVAANAITSGTIAASAVIAGKLSANAVEAGNIAANAVTSATIAALAITGDKIASNTIAANSIVANSLTAGQIQAGAISSNEIAANAINANHIAAGTITANKLLVTSLNAISANLGAVTAGIITSSTFRSTADANNNYMEWSGQTFKGLNSSNATMWEMNPRDGFMALTPAANTSFQTPIGSTYSFPTYGFPITTLESYIVDQNAARVEALDAYLNGSVANWDITALTDYKPRYAMVIVNATITSGNIFSGSFGTSSATVGTWDTDHWTFDIHMSQFASFTFRFPTGGNTSDSRMLIVPIDRDSTGNLFIGQAATSGLTGVSGNLRVLGFIA